MRSAPRLLAVLCLVALGAGCTPTSPPVAVDCRSVPSAGASGTDTLTVIMHILHHGSGRALRFLVRVDPLSEPGAVVFAEGTPPTAAAASVALTTSGTFHGCLATAPAKFELRASEAPLGRVWLRVSSNVPVVARLAVGGEREEALRDETAVIVQPGASEQVLAKRAQAAGDSVAATPRLEP